MFMATKKRGEDDRSNCVSSNKETMTGEGKGTDGDDGMGLGSGISADTYEREKSNRRHNSRLQTRFRRQVMNLPPFLSFASRPGASPNRQQ
jgi:hypothetical protein